MYDVPYENEDWYEELKDFRRQKIAMKTRPVKPSESAKFKLSVALVYIHELRKRALVVERFGSYHEWFTNWFNTEESRYMAPSDANDYPHGLVHFRDEFNYWFKVKFDNKSFVDVPLDLIRIALSISQNLVTRENSKEVIEAILRCNTIIDDREQQIAMTEYIGFTVAATVTCVQAGQSPSLMYTCSRRYQYGWVK